MTTDAAPVRDLLLGGRSPRAFNPDERRFSVYLRRCLDELLQGERNDLLLLRVYPATPERLGVMVTPRTIDRAALRPEIVRPLLEDALGFLYHGTPGGPTEQLETPDGGFAERTAFPTKYPHIVIEREDTYDTDGVCARSTWCAIRVQNQRAQTRINRLLDVANLGFEVAGALLK